MLNRLFNKQESEAAYTVCIVNDDAATVQRMLTLFQEQGYIVHCASSGEEALQLLDEVSLPDVLVVDLSMPGMNAQQFIENARVRFGRTALPPILLISDTPDAEATAKTLGIEDFLPRPFDGPALLDHVKRLVAPPPSA